MPKTSRSSCTPKSQRNEPLGDWEQIWHIEQWILSMMKTKKSFSMRCILTAYMPSTCVEFNCSNNLFDLHNEPTLEKWSSCLLVIGQWALHPVLWLYQKTRALSTSHPSHSDGNQKSGINAPVEVGSWNLPLFTGFGIHPRWLFGISEPSTVSSIHSLVHEESVLVAGFVPLN